MTAASRNVIAAAPADQDAADGGAFRKQLVENIPRLRAFAMSLASRPDVADDLVQETMMKAWHHQANFLPGSNMKAWLFTILRNEYFSQWRSRKRKREVADSDGEMMAQVATQPAQHSHLDMADLRLALARLPDDQREAIVLVGASGFSYQEVAEITGVAVGTVKSRVNRARVKLAALLDPEGAVAAAPADEQPGPASSE